MMVTVFMSAALLLLMPQSGNAGEGSRIEKITFIRAGVTIMAERPVSQEAFGKGLMFRTGLPEMEGMVFYFDSTERHAFWMFNTKIHLDILFLNEDLTIVDIQEMEPCTAKDSSACRIYTARQPARYAVEVNRGFSKKHGITVGDRVRIER